MFKQALLGTTCLLVGLLLGIAGSNFAQPVRLEAGYGTCKAKAPVEGTWYQGHLEHNLQLKDNCGEIGLSFATPVKDLRFAARYVNLGQFATHAIANADDNDRAELRGSVSDNPRREECANSFAADCHYKWDGSGDAGKGALFAAHWEPMKVGPIRFGAELGLFIYKTTWREVIHPIDCPGNQCWQMQIDQRTGWQKAPEFGLTARWEYVYIAARRYYVPDHAPITAGFKAPVDQLIIGVSIPL